MKKYLPLLLIFIVSLIFYLPIIIHPNLFLSRNNDLDRVFWPVFYYIRENFTKFHQIPLWNNLFFSGTPLLPDPQFSPVYPANLLFLVLPTSLAFFLFFFLHSIFGGITSFILARKGLSFSKEASIFFSLLYITTPRLSGYLEAGHYGLFASHAWIPLAVYSVLKLSKKADAKNAVLLGISISALYFTHTVIFILSIPCSILLFLFLIIINKESKKVRKTFFILIALFICLGLSAVTLLPQLTWMPETTRNLLSIHPDIYPNWNSFKEFFSNFILLSHTKIALIDEEKWITLGITPLIFAAIGFFNLSKKMKLSLLILLFGSFTLMMNNLSPLYSTFLFESWYQMIRVTTRFWFIPAFVLLLLSAFGFEKLIKKIKKPFRILVFGLATICILETLYISELRITSKRVINEVYAQSDILYFLKEDKDKFRVFCTTRCISQKDAAINHLELVEGYNTLQQTNYYEISRLMMGGTWNNYTLSLPPLGIAKLNPNPQLLGEYNVKYVISPYYIDNSNLIFLNFYKNNLYLYKNKLYKPRSNEDIMFYSPNLIKIKISNHDSPFLILRDVFNSDWKAFTNGKKETPLLETENKTRSVKINTDAEFVDIVYKPKSFVIGLIISLFTVFNFIPLFTMTSKVLNKTARNNDS